MIDKALEVIRQTRDGNDLRPRDLALVEYAANGLLNEAGREAFEDLHAAVTAGEYESPWEAPFHGIEHLRIDAVGYVYWRGVVVEHYTPGWCWGDEAKAAARELAAICEAIEAEGEEVTQAAVWERFGIARELTD